MYVGFIFFYLCFDVFSSFKSKLFCAFPFYFKMSGYLDKNDYLNLNLKLDIK